VLWHCWLGGRKGIRPVRKWGWWRWALVSPDGVAPSWMVCLLIFPCTIKSRSSVLAPAHPSGPGKRAVKRLWCGESSDVWCFLITSPGLVIPGSDVRDPTQSKQCPSTRIPVVLQEILRPDRWWQLKLLCSFHCVDPYRWWQVRHPAGEISCSPELLIWNRWRRRTQGAVDWPRFTWKNSHLMEVVVLNQVIDNDFSCTAYFFWDMHA